LDLAWLWTLAETRHKAARTFATVIRLMDEYPDFHFAQSQPELYLMVKEDHPELYERVKALVQEGRWEATGGMWVEADCNIPSGESLVRQLLYGRRFFQKEFGKDSPILWLPDTFGFNGQLPQLMARAGLRYFMTTKISWNEYNHFPYDSFRWRGIDGTEVLAHFVTTPSDNWYSTYNADLDPTTVLGCWREYREKEHGEALLLFGHGDGGGGPNREMLEIARRLQNLPSVPAVTLGGALEFFERLSADKDKLPVWVGELYLEYHRGTYTSQAKLKHLNRKCEALYHQAELFASFAHLLGEPYPREELKEGWQLILRNQFHDIIAGSAIGEVNEEAERDYQRAQELGEKALRKALLAIASQIALQERSLIIFNPLSWERDDVVSVLLPSDLSEPFILVDGTTGEEIPYQRAIDAAGRPALIFPAKGVPPCGYKVYHVRSGSPRAWPTGISATPKQLENGHFTVHLDGEGHIVSLYDKDREREVILKGTRANLFQAFEDRPLRNDAWDINIFYQDKRWELRDLDEIEVIEEGPVRAGVELRRSWHNSRITQRIYIYAGLSRIDFDTQVEWHERHVLLKVAFPVEMHASRATYEIQFGNIERPTHWNTSWDWARFEVPAQRWADLSEGDHGVSLLNDCKYGYDIKDNVMRLTLLKSATEPDPEADQGCHRFTYSLYPHAGDWRNGTIRRAAELNDPLLTHWEPPHPGPLPVEFSLVKVDREHVFVEAVKLAEEGEDLVVRVYEGHNQRGKVTLTFPAEVKAAWETNLLEEPEEELTPEGYSLAFFIKPYQVRTFRIRLAPFGKG
jgi:alpha-mannosidase